MKRISERTQIAKAINFNKYPVLTIDLADADEYGLLGCKVRIDAGTFDNGWPHMIDAQLRVYRDERKLTLHSGGIGLYDSFGYSDLSRIVESAQAPLIGPDMDVVIVVHDSKRRQAWPLYLVHTNPRVNKFCSTPMTFEDVDMTDMLLAAGCELR